MLQTEDFGFAKSGVVMVITSAAANSIRPTM
jgi:hypothetical protein